MEIHHINWFFNLLIGRRIVRERSLRRHGELVRIYLDEAGCREAKTLPEPVVAAVVQEAYRRAAEPEADKMARYGPHHQQLHSLSLEVAAAIKKEPTADARIRSILEWNHVI
jgi:hypothetical protein